MPIASSAEFLDHHALDRQMLAQYVELPPMRGLPDGLIELSGRNSTSKILSASFHDSISGQAIEEFKAGMRSLFLGTAWRVLDGLIELALAQDFSPPTQGGGAWRAEVKRKALEQGCGMLAEVPAQLLSIVKALYISTIEIRHALIHRKTQVAEDGSVIGYTNQGAPLRTVKVAEQLHMCELAQWLALAIEQGVLSKREQRRVLALLAQLSELHGFTIHNPPPLSGIALVKYPLDETLELDLAYVREQAGPGHSGMDLQVVAPGGTILFGEVDDVPDQKLTIDLANLPPWLKFLA